jgi:hypothetical protein
MVQNWRNYAAYYVAPASGHETYGRSTELFAMRCTPSCSPRGERAACPLETGSARTFTQ